jgi:hypothetical protein
MAISRPFLLAVVGAVLLGATVLAVQNARDSAGSDAAPAAIQADAAPAPAQTSTSDAAGTLKSAFDLSDVESGRFAAKLSFRARAVAARFGVTGTFDAAGEGLPKFDVRARISVARRTLRGGLVSLGDKAYFVHGDSGWRVPGEVWNPLVQKASAGGAAQAKVPIALHPDTWVRDVKSEGTESVGGVQTEHISARVDPQAVINDLRSAAGGEASQLPKAAAIDRAVKSADFDVWVGQDDHVLRRLSGELVLAGRGHVNLDVRLSDINKPQQIEAPAHVRSRAPTGAFGQLAQGIVGGINGVTGEQSASLEALTSPNPRRAARAVRQHRQVVILFRNSRGLDDRAMAAVVREVDRRTKALVLTDHVDTVERYGKIVEDLGVSQTPSVVIIDRSGRAQLIEGYVDSDTLTQAVADAR